MLKISSYTRFVRTLETIWHSEYKALYSFIYDTFNPETETKI